MLLSRFFSPHPVIFVPYQKKVDAVDGHSGDVLRVYNVPSVVVKLAEIGDRIIIGCECGDVYLLKIKTGAVSHLLKGHEWRISYLVVVSDSILCSASEDTTIKLWNLNTGECMRTYQGHQAAVRCVHVDATTIVTAGDDKVIKIWSRNGIECLKTLKHKNHTSAITYVAVLDDGRIVSGDTKGSICIWDVAGSSTPGDKQTEYFVTKTLTGTSPAVHSHQLYLCGNDNHREIVVYDLNKDNNYAESKWKCVSSPSCVVVNQHGVYVGHEDGSVGIYRDGECIRSFVTCTESTTVDDVVRVDSDDDGHYMYAYTASARLLGWDIDSNLCIIQRRQPLIDPSIAIAHDNDVYAATYDGHLRVCRASSGQCIMSFKCGKRVTCMEVCENDLVFVGTEAGEVLLYHGSCPTPVRTYNAQDAIRCLYYKDGLIFGGSDDGLVHVWEVDTAELMTTFTGHDNLVLYICVYGTTLVTYSVHHKMIAYNAETADMLWTVADATRVTGMKAVDGLLYCSSWSGTVAVYDVKTGEIVHILTGHESAVLAMVIDKDKVYTAGADGYVYEYDRAVTTRIARPCATVGVHNKNCSVIALALVHGVIASAGTDGLVRIWTSSKGVWKLLHVCTHAPTPIVCMTYSDDNIFTLHDNGDLYCLEIKALIQLGMEVIRGLDAVPMMTGSGDVMPQTTTLQCRDEQPRYDGDGDQISTRISPQILRVSASVRSRSMEVVTHLVLLLIGIVSLLGCAFVRLDWDSDGESGGRRAITWWAVWGLLPGDDVGALYHVALWSSYALIVVFLIVFILQERFENTEFLHPYSSYNSFMRWFVMITLRFISEGLMFPVNYIVLNSYRCNNGYLLLDPSMECYNHALHVMEVIVSALLLLLYFVLNFRFRRVGNNIDNVEVHYNIFDWREDHFVHKFMHPFSHGQYGPALEMSSFFVKMFVIISVVFTDDNRYLGAALCLSFIINAVLPWITPPYFSGIGLTLYYSMTSAVAFVGIDAYLVTSVVVTGYTASWIAVIGSLICGITTFMYIKYKDRLVKDEASITSTSAGRRKSLRRGYTTFDM